MMQIDRISQTQAPVRRPRAARYLSSTALATLIALGAAGAVSSQQWTGAVDNDYGTAGNWTPTAVPGDGNTDNALVSGIGNLANVDGADTFTPALVTIQSAATVSVDGQLGTGADQSDIDVNGATLSINATGTVDGDVGMRNPGAIVTIANGGTLTGTATVNRGTLTNDGTIGGGIDTTGGNSSVAVTVGATGSVGGPVTHGAGTLNSEGALNGGLSVGNGATATINGGSVTGGTTVGLGTLNINGGTLDGVTLNGGQNGGVVNNVSNAINGPVIVNGGEFNSDGTITGTVTTNGGMTNVEGTINGDVTVNAGSNFTNVDALTHTGNFTNNGALNVSGGDLNSSGGIFTNTGNISIADGRMLDFDGTMNNNQRIGLNGGVPGAITATIGGGVAGMAGSTFDTQNGAAGDSMIVQGGVSGTNTVAIDLDLTTTNAGFADVLTVNGQLNGNVTIEVDQIGGNTLQLTPITVVDATSFGGGLTTTLTGDLPQGPVGLILYSILEDNANGDIQIQSELNSALGGVAAAFSSVQSLVGSVVNRPSGAYVSGIAFDTPNNCSTGVWGRVLGGRVDSDSATRNALGTTINSNGDLDYAGFQGGADFGCFEAFDGGWDISGGALVGLSFGEFTERASGLITAGDFDQYFLGGYVAAARGNWSGEMQVRYESADFTFDNPGLDVRNADASVDSYTISGSVTYRHELQPGLAVLPSAGFSVTESDSASLTLTNPMGTPTGTLTIGSHTNVTTFLGATLSKTTVNEAAASATNAFLTGTYYFDGSGSRDSTFRTADGLASTTLSTSEVGDFGEISAGGSIVRIIGKGPGGVRQVNYSVRVDARYGDDLDGVGVTGQIRYQF